MRIAPRFNTSLLLLLGLALSSCGGGTNTAGVGGSGVGGTGITTITGNVSQVVAEAPGDPSLNRKLLAAVTRFLSAPANAQSGMLGDIQVFGGGRITTTDGGGNFELEEVSPSQNFVLSFTLEDDQTIALPIGAVPAGTRVRVINVVLDTNQGFASAGDVEIEDDDSVDDDSNDDGSGDGEGTDEDSMDGDSEDDGSDENGGNE